ncbi:unnamed protein product [Lactuca virosa]|uniref:Uncharacterized protein n=1 Tax=Lactuca virosa TaxID=75947 RepID=A0AAU9M4H5_9ASTR|nr:unnamed protein product [Lactuca virosa]
MELKWQGLTCMIDNTIPIWVVRIIAIVLPLVVILIYYFIRKDVYDLHQEVLGPLFSVLVTRVLTDAIKYAVERPRPDFSGVAFLMTLMRGYCGDPTYGRVACS